MVTLTPPAAAGHGTEHRIELRPNCSLTPRGARLFVGSLAVVTFSVAGFFALQASGPCCRSPASRSACSRGRCA